MSQLITVRSENDRFQYIESLTRNREKRSKHKQFFVEGVRSINLAVERNWAISALIFAGDRRLSEWAQGLLATANAPTHYELPSALMAKLSRKDETSEILAILRMPDDDFDRIPLPEDLLVLVFDRPSSPGNIGSLIRSCDALGAHGVIVTGHAADVYDPETIRASTGSLFAVPVVRQASHHELIPWLARLREARKDLQVVATDETGDRVLYDHDFRRPTVLLVGNETRGLSQAYRQLAQAVIRIPIGGAASSLNAACAGSIVLYEIHRQRHVQT